MTDFEPFWLGNAVDLNKILAQKEQVSRPWLFLKVYILNLEPLWPPNGLGNLSSHLVYLQSRGTQMVAF